MIGFKFRLMLLPGIRELLAFLLITKMNRSFDRELIGRYDMLIASR